MIPKVPYYLNLDQLICFCHTHVRIVRLHMILFLHLIVYKHVFHQHGPGMCFERKLQRARALHAATPILIFNNWPHQLWTECAGPDSSLPECSQKTHLAMKLCIRSCCFVNTGTNNCLLNLISRDLTMNVWFRKAILLLVKCIT